MSSRESIRLFPCLLRWAPKVKCPNYVFLDKSACVDCQRLERRYGTNELAAADIHEIIVRYLVDKCTERGGITYESIDEYILSARRLSVDNLLPVALETVFRNFNGLYLAVCNAVKAARDKGPNQWRPVNLAERVERIWAGRKPRR